MKKTFLVFLILAIFAAIPLLLLFKFVRSLGISDPTKLLSADTLAFACTPNLIQTAFRWPHTRLAKIIGETDVKEFINSSLPPPLRAGRNLGPDILAVKPKTMFLAITQLSPQGAQVLLGFQFLGSYKKANEALEFLRNKIAHGVPVLSRSSSPYNGDSIETIVYRNSILHSAMHGRWVLISNDLSVLQRTLDRAAGKIRTPSLRENADYLKVMAQLPKRPDLKVFIASKAVLNALLAIGASMGCVPNPEQVRQLQGIGAFAITSKFEGENFRDSGAVVLRNPPKIPPLRHIAMRFTQPTTVGYLEVAKQGFPFFEMSLLSDKFFAFLAEKRLSMKSLDQIFGSEAALFWSWPSTRLRPPTILVTEIQDRSQAIRWLDQMGLKPLSSNPRLPSVALYQLESSEPPLIVPTVAFRKNLLFAGLTGTDVESTLSLTETSATLANSPIFASALRRYHAQNVFFAFINTREVFERIYALLRPIIIFGAAMKPDAMQQIAVSKLPPAESVGKHLQPIVAIQKIQGNVMIFDSTGPITLDQAILVFLSLKVGLDSLTQP
ncbi:MAG: hypothetical protein C5B47_04290 [Verrucomicrobia bacterium]|nr:MAG: hypothetical protein C5B47_04290 [Verrucomicrobiota bacterium]